MEVCIQCAGAGQYCDQMEQRIVKCQPCKGEGKIDRGPFSEAYYASVRWADIRLVILESPFAGDVQRNTAYAQRALLDSLKRNEAPIAPHLTYTQVLDDLIPEQRAMGIAAGLAWRRAFIEGPHPKNGIGEWVPVLPVFYVDLGWSRGMEAARELYTSEGITFLERQIL